MDKPAGTRMMFGLCLLLAPSGARAEEPKGDEPPPVAEVGPAALAEDEPPPVAEPEPPAAPPEQEANEETAPAAKQPRPPTAFAPAAQAGDVLSTFGLHIGAGFTFGGDEIITLIYSDGSTSTLYAGQGLSIGGGVTWTPLWLNDRVGLGLGYDVGYKLGTTSSNADGTIEMERVPMVLSVRGLVALAANYHFLLAAGGVAEFGPHVYGTGVATGSDLRFSDAFGGMIEAGILFGAPLSLGAEITGRFTAIEYEAMGEKLSGLSGGMNFALHFFL